MSRNVEVVRPDQTIRDAATFMLRTDSGSMPVYDEERLVGMITDRDIAVRAVANGLGPETPVREAMSGQLICCYEDEDIAEVAMKMSDAQVRRIPVMSRGEERLVGIVSLGDISRSDESDAAGVALDGVTDPGGAHNQTAEV
jgi:CBS domain-containing protein